MFHLQGGVFLAVPQNRVHRALSWRSFSALAEIVQMGRPVCLLGMPVDTGNDEEVHAFEGLQEGGPSGHLCDWVKLH